MKEGKTEMSEPVLPPDQAQRGLIVEELDKTMLVEAAAGTGKTTGMLDRMVALIREGLCQVDTLAAVTFTRKAAAELRARFQVELEQAARKAAGVEAERLLQAVSGAERCFIGTIHSFCARLLRERPIEAGVDLAFQELDEELDRQFRETAWDEFVSRLGAQEDPRLDQLRELGLQLDQLRAGFMQFANYSDVQQWDAPEIELADWAPLIGALQDYLQQMAELVPTFPVDRGNDKMMSRYEQIVLLARNRNLNDPAQLMEVLELFKPTVRWVLSKWPGGTEQANSERDCWLPFCEDVVKPVSDRWLAKRYRLMIDLMTGAAEQYRQRRQASGRLNYQDLLMKASALLRDKPQVRDYFRARFTHLLVDEFQDTDPVQAEVMMFLTADDRCQQNWRQCQPVPGSLFVVGDPKQSIYRFRRADILTYNQVKTIISSSGGIVVSLTANFRTRQDLVQWGNDIFDAAFPEEANQYCPASSAMLVAREEGVEGDLTGIQVLEISEEDCLDRHPVEVDADRIARTIRHLLDTEATVPRTARELERGISPQVNPGDFMIVTWGKKNLAHYGRMLQELGIPFQVSGGRALSQVPELELLNRSLRATVEPDNPVALVAALRSRLFGISDEELFALRQAGGHFSYQSAVPEKLADETRNRFQAAFSRLQSHHQWLRRLPPVAAMERIAWDLGLTISALTEVGGNVQAGSIAKVMEILREQQAQFPSVAELIEYLAELIESEAEFDGLPARAHREPLVRLMNLHKVKGLEAPVVFLADPTGKWSPSASIHIDRSSDEATGYVAFYGGSAGSFHRPLLARPLDWDRCQNEEQEFLDFERKRLLYVAATRAGTRLIVSQKEKRNNTNYWKFFEDYLQDCPRLPDPGEQSPPEIVETDLATEIVEQAEEQIARSWQQTRQATYATGAAKEMTVQSEEHQGSEANDGQGASWGSVIHLLLETLMQQPGSGLENLAYTALEEEGLDVARVDEAIAVVNRVVDSEIWQRALESDQRLVEVPFEHCLPADESEAGVPTIVRGVIDLMFQEADGWVVVDYKTDQVTPDTLSRVVDQYRGQISGYAETWQFLTGQKVKEKGLYLTRLDQFVTVD